MKYFLSLLLIITNLLLVGQEINEEIDSSQIYLNRRKGLFIGSVVTYGASMYGLNALWYKNYPRGPFHFQSDNHQWLQVDKVGHFYSAYGESVLFLDAVKWAGVPSKQAAWIGGSYGFFAQTVIEILDGFSVEWGASSGDLIANTMGSALVIGQELAWQQQRIRVKWGFHPVNYPNDLQARAHSLYGSEWYESFMKDYNGQTYWLSFNIKDFNQSTKLPKWLNIAVGYGGEQMYGGDDNSWELEDGSRMYRYDIPRVRQYYISLDADLRHLKGTNKVVNTLIAWLNVLKVPFPAIEYSKELGLRFHPIYF